MLTRGRHGQTPRFSDHNLLGEKVNKQSVKNYIAAIILTMFSAKALAIDYNVSCRGYVKWTSVYKSGNYIDSLEKSENISDQAVTAVLRTDYVNFINLINNLTRQNMLYSAGRIKIGNIKRIYNSTSSTFLSAFQTLGTYAYGYDPKIPSIITWWGMSTPEVQGSDPNIRRRVDFYVDIDSMNRPVLSMTLHRIERSGDTETYYSFDYHRCSIVRAE